MSTIDYPRLAREQAITALKREQFAKLVAQTKRALKEALPDDPEEALEFLHRVQHDLVIEVMVGNLPQNP